ncbi:MAG: PilZ domain-containing protein [Deltaproteobacteria bacterium]|nr:PilZ domain-containing protein [Deltaproteobacteria bacterium]
MPTANTFKEKRKHERIDYDASVELGFDDGERHAARIVNISLGGVFLKADSQPEFGSRVHLYFELPRVDDLCEIPCLVRWIKKDRGIGLQFEHLRAIETWAISKLLRDLKED